MADRLLKYVTSQLWLLAADNIHICKLACSFFASWLSQSWGCQRMIKANGGICNMAISESHSIAYDVMIGKAYQILGAPNEAFFTIRLRVCDHFSSHIICATN